MGGSISLHMSAVSSAADLADGCFANVSRAAWASEAAPEEGDESVFVAAGEAAPPRQLLDAVTVAPIHWRSRLLAGRGCGPSGAAEEAWGEVQPSSPSSSSFAPSFVRRGAALGTRTTRLAAMRSAERLAQSGFFEDQGEEDRAARDFCHTL